MDNHGGKGNLHERECSTTMHHRLKGAQKTSSESDDKALKNKWTNDAMADDDLEEIVGGVTAVVVPLCKKCQERIAVHQMTLCAVCFLKLK